MKKPQAPPEFNSLLTQALEKRNMDFFASLINAGKAPGSERYLPWDQFRWRRSPEGISDQEWWLATKIARRGMQRPLPLNDALGREFTYALPDEVLRGIESVDKQASGQIEVPEPVTHEAPTRARYIVNSLIEEAITSSQLEGASTEYRVAKNMLRSGRRPRTKDEQMILNNYEAMQQVSDLRHEPLTPELICEIHRIVTKGTLDNPDLAGKIQLPSDNRVKVIQVGFR